jgi:hypothetical protein
MLPLGAFRPDAATPNSGFAKHVSGVIPALFGEQLGYVPFAQLVPATGAEALPAEPRGVISIRLFDGSYRIYAGTATDIYELQSDFTWMSISSGHALPEGEFWSFAHFGSYLINTNIVDGMRAYNVETPAGNNLISGAPVARFVFSCNNVLFALDCDGNNRRFESSGIGDHTEWKLKGANGKTLEDGGALTCGFDMKNGVAVMLQDSAVRGIQFGGSTGSLYSLFKIADGMGSIGARSAMAFNGRGYYLTNRGFAELTVGAEPTLIGADKVDEWFRSQVEDSDLSQVQGAIDPVHEIAVWRVNSETLLCFHFRIREWSTLPASVSVLSRIATSGIALDDMDSYGLLDDMDYLGPLDTPSLQGDAPVFGGLDADYKFATFSGLNMAVEIETALLNSPVTGILNRMTPITDAPNNTIAVHASDLLETDPTWGTANGRERDGSITARARGLNMAFRQVIPEEETWTYTLGIDHFNKSMGGPR